MEYPQVFICIDKKTELPSIEVLEGWADNKTIHTGFASFTSHPNIKIINEIHKMKCYSEVSHILALNSTNVPEMLQIFFADKIENVYWIDSEEHLNRIQKVVIASNYLESFRDCIYGLEVSIDSIKGILSNLKDEYIDELKNFHDCLEDKTSEIYDGLALAVAEQARIETRMNILIRLDF